MAWCSKHGLSLLLGPTASSSYLALSSLQISVPMAPLYLSSYGNECRNPMLDTPWSSEHYSVSQCWPTACLHICFPICQMWIITGSAGTVGPCEGVGHLRVSVRWPALLCAACDDTRVFAAAVPGRALKQFSSIVHNGQARQADLKEEKARPQAQTTSHPPTHLP